MLGYIIQPEVKTNFHLEFKAEMRTFRHIIRILFRDFSRDFVQVIDQNFRGFQGLTNLMIGVPFSQVTSEHEKTLRV